MPSRLEILSRDQIGLIHANSLKILSQIGVKFRHEIALKIFKDAGAEVSGNGVVKIPEHLVKEAISKAPREFVWHARCKEHDLHIGSGKTYFGGPYGYVYVLDVRSGERRPATLKDVEEFTKVIDAIDGAHGAGGMILEPSDVDPRISHLHVLLTMMKNTGKSLMGHVYGRKARECIGMASVLLGGKEELLKKPFIAASVNPVSPLKYARETVEGMLVYAEHRQPAIITPMAMGGASAPITIAGLLSQQNAEILAALALIQLVQPGTPVMYGTASCPLEMRSGIPSIGSPEAAIINAASVQIGHFYGLPTRASGGVTDSKIPDVQAGYEKGITALIATLAGADFMLHAVAGSLEYYMTGSLVQLAIDGEFAEGISHLLRNAEIDLCSDAFAFDVIAKVGHEGHFLAEPHTRVHIKSVLWMPKVLDKDTWESWRKKGRRGVVERAKERVERILREHEPVPIDRAVLRDLEEFVRKIEKEELKQGSR